MSNELEGKVVIVTGGGHGIGRFYCRHLAEHGAAVVVAELDGAAGEAVAKELQDEGYKSLAVRTDVTSEADVNNMVEATINEFGTVHIVVNNAAMFATVPMSRAPFDELSVSEWDKMMSVNLKGTWLVCKAVASEMRKNRYGKIITISSGTALKGSNGRIHYVASKAGILGFTKTLANELGKYNVCVNCIAPGNTLSEENPDESIVKMREAAAKTRALKRVQKPEDMLGAVLFLSSPASDFITGQTLVVDGGSAMH
ncbi:SDR family NAD(P)-dependent oxidoreductase [Marinobacter sp. BSs20148]|jgi:3-oxoacyl-[acyl-carrier protein] reductase|uniref:SDR family NAD(P)-dependent oxidoreductase n=1 Tax=Marinobacter sp. BSs20148 TaxID=490759 RepID=UPI0002776946|nr:3-oxoacyl-ACP reductase family protein [Marinobacter sp. BSs20148]AFP30300.1 3-oxoacyl-[acyl-carrier-protein] reductase FabG [Marinobacter sp. BSs20148]